jgi:hypothetical protein
MPPAFYHPYDQEDIYGVDIGQAKRTLIKAKITEDKFIDICFQFLSFFVMTPGPRVCNYSV